MSAPRGRVRVELWDDLPAAAGARLAFVSGEQAVLAVETPDALDFTGQATLRLVPSPAMVAALQTVDEPVWRLVPLAADGGAASDPVEHWRGLTDELALAPGSATLTVTAVHPLLDFDKVGRVRTVATGGVTTYTVSGEYTPTQALQIAVAAMASAGRAYWAVGTVDRTDVKRVEIADVTPLELLHRVAAVWESELDADHASGETVHRVHLRSRVGAGAAVAALRLDEGGALLAVTRRRDATGLAHVVTPIGAGGASMARAAWSVEAVNLTTGWVDLVDPAGGYGPVQIDGQFVGACLRAADGSRQPILDSQRGDGWTSRVRVSVAGGLPFVPGATPRQHVEIAADASGTLLTSVADPRVPAARRVAVTLERTDLPVDRNYLPNPRGASGTPPTGWVLAGGATLTRGTPPAGCPIGTDGTGQMWKLTLPGSAASLKLPNTNVLDVPSGDQQFVLSAWVWIVNAGDDLLLDADGTLGVTSTPLTSTGQWVRIDEAGPLGAPAAVHPRFTTMSATAVEVWIAAVMLQRAAGGSPPWTEYERPTGQALHQAANAHLLGHLAPPVQYPSAQVDEARLAVALTQGGDVDLVARGYGIADRARLVGRRRTRHAPQPSDLTLVVAPDPAVAAQIGAVSPGRARSLTEQLVADLNAR